MKHYLITRHSLAAKDIFSKVPSGHQVSVLKDPGKIKLLPQIDGMVFVLVEELEGFPFQNLRQHFSKKKIILLSNKINDDDLKKLQYEDQAYDLHFNYPVDFSEVQKMYEMLAADGLTQLRGVEKKYKKEISLEDEDAQSSSSAELPADEISRLLTADMNDNTVIEPSQKPPTSTHPEDSTSQVLKDELPQRSEKLAVANKPASDPMKYEAPDGIGVKDVLQSKDDQIFKLLGLNKSLKEKVAQDTIVISHLEQDLRDSRQRLEMISKDHEQIKLELSGFGKKYEEERQFFISKELNYNNKIKILEEQIDTLNEQLSKKINQEVFDIKKVKAREEELEEKLALLQADTSMQLQNRELKITELKRKIDLIDFDLNNAIARENNLKTKVKKLEACLEKVSRSLGGVLHLLDDDDDESVKDLNQQERKKA